MSHTRINIVLGILLAIAGALAVAMDVDHTRPNIEFLPEMKRSAAFDSYETNPVLPNGRTIQPPVRGTIPRGNLPLYYAATKEDAERAGKELQNPFALREATDASDVQQPPAADQQQDVPTEERKPDPRAQLDLSIQRGAKIYSVFCQSCHGATGAGDGSVAKRGFPPPPPLTTGKSVEMLDGQLFHILTYGQGSMSPMAAQLSQDRRWDVINYVRGMQRSAKQSQSNAADIPGDAAAAGLSDVELPKEIGGQP